MTLLERFRDEVLNTKGSFELNYKDKHYSFMRCVNGNAEYIYGDYKFYNEYFSDDAYFSDIDLKYELVAIVDMTTEIIYIVNEYMFKTGYEVGSIYPEGCHSFSRYVAEKNEYLQEVLFRNYYNNIEIDISSVTDEEFINTQKKQARRIILSKNEIVLPKFNREFTHHDIAKMICEYTNIEDEVNKMFADNRDSMIKMKLGQELIKKYIAEKSVVEDWEIKLAESINDLKANYVNVEFNFNGNVGSEKIDPKNIIGILIGNGYFSSYNFATSKSGDKLLKILGVANEFYKRDTWLTCKHITKITYVRKILYERKQNG